MRVNTNSACGSLAGAQTPLASCPPASEEVRSERVPAAGNGNGSSLNNAGSNGNYWSSTPNSSNSNNAWNLNFNSGSRNTNNNNRNNGQSVRAVSAFTKPENGGPSQLFHDLYAAYHEARRHKRGKRYEIAFEAAQEREIARLRDALEARTWKPHSSTTFIIHEPKMREVFAADFRDRVVHHLFHGYTHALFERTFIRDAYSCVKGRGVHDGIERLKGHIRSCSESWTKPCYVLKLDIKGYFMHINRERLLARCREILAKMKGRISDEPGKTWGRKLDYPLVDFLLERIIMQNPAKDCRVIGSAGEWEDLPPDKSLFKSPEGCGLPIGNLSSQLFSNIYLGMFDDFMKRDLKCRRYGRYVDDVYVVAGTKEELRAVIEPARAFLRERLGLMMGEEKVQIYDAYRGVEFLGAFVLPFRTYMARRTLGRIRERMRKVNLERNPARAQAQVNSMLGALSHFASYRIREKIVREANLRRHGRVSEDCLRYYPKSAFDRRVDERIRKIYARAKADMERGREYEEMF